MPLSAAGETSSLLLWGALGACMCALTTAPLQTHHNIYGLLFSVASPSRWAFGAAPRKCVLHWTGPGVVVRQNKQT